MYALIPPDGMVKEAIENIDRALTKHAMTRVKGGRRNFVLRTLEVFHLRLLLAEVKRLRKEQDDDSIQQP